MARTAKSLGNAGIAAQDALRDHFLGWQCRLRQIAMRKHGGQPSAGMRPRVVINSEEAAAGVVMLLLPRDPEESTEFFRSRTQRTHDPKQVYDQGLAYLQAGHFQTPADFSDVLTAVFSPSAPLAATLDAAGRCVLEFDQFSQRYTLPCAVTRLVSDNPVFQATYWHNRIFNPKLPPDVCALAFAPDWAVARADPPIS